MRRYARKGAMHKRILYMLIRRYDRPIMNNVDRGDYIECMIASALGAAWRLTWEDGWDWAAWDCVHVPSGARLEIKQAAARQSWDRESERPRRNPDFDIALRRGYWPKEGFRWIERPGRQADLYVFAWHGRRDEHADHRDPGQWRFFVVAERSLPAGQKSIRLSKLEKIATSCGVAELGRAVEAACPAPEDLKATLEGPSASL